MSLTGYQDVVFTEINPTSTTTVITMFYDPGYYQTTFALGPVTIAPNVITPTTPTVTEPTTVTVTPTVTVDSTPTTVTRSLTTRTQPSCELIIAALSLVAILDWYCL